MLSPGLGPAREEAGGATEARGSVLATREPSAASASDSCCHPVTNCSNRRQGKGPTRQLEDRGAHNTDPRGESFGVSPRDSEAQVAQKDSWVGHSLTPREADPSRGWESHGSSCVWGPKKTGEREALASFAGQAPCKG